MTVRVGGNVVADTNAALSLKEAAYPTVAAIDGHMTFYPDRVDGIEIDVTV